MSEPTTRILCILPGLQPLALHRGENEFWCLSEFLSGYVLSPVWGRPVKGEASPVAVFGRFEYYITRSQHLPSALRTAWHLIYLVSKGTSLFYTRGRFAAIVAYGPFTTAVAGWCIRLFTGAKLIVEFPGNPTNSFLLNARTPSRIDRLKTRVSRVMSPLVTRAADHLRLLYPRQLDEVARVPADKTSAFHYFTSIESIVPAEDRDPFVLCLGGPWYRKGVDLLIRAFRAISEEFPEVSLRVHGYTGEREFYESLAEGHPRIHLGKPVPHSEALELIRRCRVYACPSRSEGFPRVIAEAMAAATPVVGSDVDGIPFYVKDSVTGLIARNEDASDLAAKLRTLLSDPNAAARLGQHAREYALEHLTDRRYAEKYRDMVGTALGKPRA
jgi:glycosyltransferase involved in cell wall biosynthesis